MATPYFDEVQRLRDNPWGLVLLLVVALGSVLPLLYGLYWQLMHGEPWGNEPLPDAQLVALTAFIILVVAAASFVVVNLRLEIKVDGSGISYRMFPIKRKWRLITQSEIEAYSFENRYKLFQSRGIGYHKNIFKKTLSLRISGGKHIIIRLRNNHQILLGTQNPGSFEWAMRKMMNKTTVY